MPALKTGALTRDELRQIWESASDPGYWKPIEEAGDGNGFEVWTQFFEQVARASRAIDVTTQAMFIAPWSGQTNPPAGGAAKARVTLSISRSKRLEIPLFLAAGQFVVAEQTTDAGEDGPIELLTGRRYVLAESVFFFPGEQGPFAVEAEASLPGYGFNNPLPGTIAAIEQVASVFENDLATVDATYSALAAATSSRAMIVADNQADMFVPEHVGQAIAFVGGANAGETARAIRFEGPRPAEFLGSALELELLWCVSGQTFAGTFRAGELVSIFAAGPVLLAIGLVVAEREVAGEKRLAFDLLQRTGTIAVACTITGSTSAATMTIASLSDVFDPTSEAPVAGTGGAAWRVLDWVEDWGLVSTHEASPDGGRSPMLDELGGERAVYRSPGESDDAYRERIRELGDVVAPNAIRRTIARSFPYSWDFFEAGTTWAGIYYDGTNEPPSLVPGRQECDAYDTDVISYAGTPTGTFVAGEPVVVEDALFRQSAAGYAGRFSGAAFLLIRKTGRLPLAPAEHVRGLISGATFAISSATIPATVAARRHRTYLDYEQFRAFFWIEVANLGAGEFGFAYDAGSANAYDVGFFDGFPRLARDSYRALWQAVDRARAEGVGFELIRRT